MMNERGFLTGPDFRRKKGKRKFYDKKINETNLEAKYNYFLYDSFCYSVIILIEFLSNGNTFPILLPICC